MYITKSMLGSYDFCPYQFKVEYIDRERRQETIHMVIGTRMHEFFDKFYEYYDELPMDDLYSIIPDDFEDIERMMAENFISVEQERMKMDTFRLPRAREIMLTSDNLQLRGNIDRVDYADGGVTIVEYKTGKSVKLAQIKKEIAFYKLLWEDAYPDEPVVNGALYNPRMNVYKEFNVMEKDVEKVRDNINTLKRAIENNSFDRNIDVYKCKFCGICLSNIMELI